MSVVHTDRDVTVYQGDALEILPLLPEASIDAVVCDPPYGIAFMGKDWDQPGPYGSRRRNGTPGKAHREGNDGAGAMDASRYDLSAQATGAFQAWCTQWAGQCLRLLRPGGHLLAFGGPRSWHRLACGLEDAGLEIRDSTAWLHGQGFPKSRNLHHQHEGWGTALKLAFEPCVVARKPLDGTVAQNVSLHGTGALNIDACRIHGSGSQARSYEVRRWKTGAQLARTGGSWKPEGQDAATYSGRTKDGRWPTNVVLDTHVASELDSQAPSTTSAPSAGRGPADASGPSRYFPAFRWQAKAPTGERPYAGGIQHPTVKPLELMRWLIRLAAPYGGTVLDPFAGSGTTVEAALSEGMKCVAIERERTYLPLITQRIGRVRDIPLNLWGGGIP